MYQSTFDRILASDMASSKLAKRILSWLCYAQSPLYEAELQHAIATEVDDEDFDPDGITPGEILRASCLGIVVRDERGAYSLFHMTAYEFLRNSPELNTKAAHLLIAKTCMSYLSFACLGPKGPCVDLATLEARKQKYALFDYAAKHWADHARRVEEKVVEIIMPFVSNAVIRQSFVQAFYHRERQDADLGREMFETLPSGSSALHVACGRGLLFTAKGLLHSGADPNEPDNQGWTPLIAASSYRHVGLVRLLLIHVRSASERADIDRADKDGWTALFWAILKGHCNVAELLLAAGASFTVSDRANMTPVDWAAFRSDKPLVDLLQRHSSRTPITEQIRRYISRGGSTEGYSSEVYYSFEAHSSRLLAAATCNKKTAKVTMHSFESFRATKQPN
jgi:hypothetical protein